MDLHTLEQALTLDIQSLLAVFSIFALAGFVSGLSGFGFSAVGIAVLWFMNPSLLDALFKMVLTSALIFLRLLIKSTKRTSGVTRSAYPSN